MQVESYQKDDRELLSGDGQTVPQNNKIWSFSTSIFYDLLSYGRTGIFFFFKPLMLLILVMRVPWHAHIINSPHLPHDVQVLF